MPRKPKSSKSSTKKHSGKRSGSSRGTVRVRGCQSYLTVATGTATGIKPFQSGTVQYAILNPVTIGGVLGIFAQIYTKWRVNRMTLTVIPNCALTGQVALGYIADGNEASDTLTPSFLQVTEIKPSLQVTFGEGSNVHKSSLHIPSSPWLYTDADNTSNTFKERFDAAGVIFGAFNAQPTASAADIAYIRMDWDCSFAGMKFSETLTKVVSEIKFTPSSRIFDHCCRSDLKRSNKDEKEEKGEFVVVKKTCLGKDCKSSK